MRSTRRARALGWLGLLGLAACMPACATRPIPLSAQAGSTIVVPVKSLSGGEIGYGGTAYTDHQRGKLVFQLDGPGGFELSTRFTIAARAHPASSMAEKPVLEQHFPHASTAAQILSLVDIPANAPVGTHELHVVLRRPGLPDAEGPVWNDEIRILPNSISVNGGAETIVGAPTPSAIANCSFYCGFGFEEVQAIPRPQVSIDLAGNGSALAAFEMDVIYPSAVIDVVDAVEELSFAKTANDAPMLWIEDDGAGTVQIRGVAHPDAVGLETWDLRLVFELDDGASQILDPAAVTVLAFTAYDLDGNVLPAASAVVAGIR